MTAMEFCGCTFIAFGPAAAMFAFTVAGDPVRIIILIASAFFWLVSLLLSSALWFAVVPLRKNLAFGVVFSVAFQEIFRLLYHRLLRRAETGLKRVTENEAAILNNRHILSYVSGLGFGIMSGAFSLINVLAESYGPGTVGLYGDSNLFFITSALTTMAFILLHTLWGLIAFDAMDKRAYGKVGIVFATHMAASLLTLLNPEQLYVATLVPIYLLLAPLMLWAFLTVGGTYAALRMAFMRSCLSCKSQSTAGGQ